ncbi:MAG: hybrid sensor histidine kinase/response regulator [Bacteroidales bacterium]|nr:hybrid sensor histidine kinase/response regulator [Bacteroidales bacterium]
MAMDNDKSESLYGTSILIVDDNPQNLQVLGRLLQAQSCEIEFAISGIAALDWLESKKFDIVLLDINMPEIDGFEVCRRIRAQKRFDNLPVIFLSADNDRESILKGFELGGQDFVTKPFDSRELIVRVKTHISLKDSLEKLGRLNKSLEEKVQERTLQLRIANENLEKMNLKLTELDNAKSEFLNLISHEIRTPLNGIILPVELLKDSGSPSEIKELVEILDSSVKRLEKFSLNALLITRLKTRPFEIKKSDIDIEDIISEVIQEEQQTVVGKRLTINRISQPDLLNVSGDRDLVKKCILNIVDNAVAFSPAGCPIEIKTRFEDQYVILEISDNGNGIPDEIIEKGSEPFSRGHEYNDKSTGIGLPLSRLIMEAHGGDIILRNKPDGGASVKLRFLKNH